MRNAFDGVVLGSASHPHLKMFSGFVGPQNWQMLAGPIAGDPVDFDLAPPAGAGTDLFGRACGAPVAPRMGFPASAPTLGNASFRLDVTGLPLAPALLVVGTSDQAFGAIQLPAPLPGGCEILVAPQVVLVTATNAAGAATQPLPIPNDPALARATAFAQWLLLPAGGIASSEAIALHLDR